MSKQVKAYLAAILFSLIIGLSMMFVKITLLVANPIDTLAHRFTIAFLMANILVLLKIMPIRLTLKDIRYILPLAILHPMLFLLFQVLGLVYTSSSEAGIFQATIPIFTLILATLFLKENSNFGQKISIFLSVFGVIYIFIMNGLNIEAYSLKGTILILLSALCFSGYNVLARKLTKEYSLSTLTYLMTLVSFLTFNSIAVLNHISEGSLHTFFLPFKNLPFVLSILYLAIMATLFSVFLSNYALYTIEAAKMSVFNNLTTLVAILAGVLFLNESIHYYHIIGAIVIISGVFGTNYSVNKKATNVKQN